MNSPRPSAGHGVESPFDSPTFALDMSIRVDAPVGAMSISSSSRDVVLASKQGLHIVDLDNPYDPPRFLPHLTAWSVADVQWSPHASKQHWVVSTSNQNALLWNLAMPSARAIEHTLSAHERTITDINFSAHDPEMLATCSIDSFVYLWDLRTPRRPAMAFADWFAGATQVKFNRQKAHVLASAHDKYLYIWDMRMGAQEVRKINAHSTKIYGIDWNRTRASGIITCALDKCVKFWDYEKTPEDEPERVIHTPFPVWRARHTPFGWGVLTMPQRGDTSLYLWDRRAKGETNDEPVEKFDGHTDHVKEFVWRWRGGERDNNGDDREFQLVSWGLDQDIRLWAVSKEAMAKIGHDPTVKMRFRITRKGSKYITFRDEEDIIRRYREKAEKEGKVPPKLALANVQNANGASGTSFIGQHFTEHKSGTATPVEKKDRGFMRAAVKRQKDVNPIAWMRGVKIGKKALGESILETSRSTARGDFGLGWDAPENLGDEISFVGSKFPKISFEKVNISGRTCTVSLTGPWGVDEKWVFLRTEVTFPPDYPGDGESIPTFSLEKTNNIPDRNIEIAESTLQKIAQVHVNRRRVCLEACLCYLLGERAEDAVFMDSDEEEESSDDEEAILDFNGEDEEGPSILTQQMNQASVPLPRNCGATWSHDGRLVCFFPPKEEKQGRSLLSSLSVRDGDRSIIRSAGGVRLWEAFGRLGVDSPTPDGGEDSDSTYTSTESSDEDDINGPLRPHLGWRLKGGSAIGRAFKRAGSADRSTQRSTGTGAKIVAGPLRGKSVVSIYDMSSLIPMKKDLAEQYRIYGDGPEVCAHNADVAEKGGYAELADIWRLVGMILCNEVPLEVFSSDALGGTEMRVLARRASLVAGRRDSGLGMEMDDEEDAEMEMMFGRVRWGGHPLGGEWLVRELFAYFERKADVQMLGMLSCVLSEPTSSRIEDGGGGIDIPAPPSYTASPFTPLLSLTPPTHRSALPTGPSSYSSSLALEAPFSTGATPPSSHLFLNETFSPTAFASLPPSPETRRGPRRFPSSPPRKRPSPAESMLAIAPFSTSGVTWGAITTFGTSGSKAESEDEERLVEKEDPLPGKAALDVSVFMNENWDDEAFLATPLLSPSLASRFSYFRSVYASTLFLLALPYRRLEVLKYNHLPASTTSSAGLLLGRTPTRWDGCEIAGCCSKCGEVLNVTEGARGECKACKRRQVTMNCVVCEVIVKGLYGACLRCGHVGHAGCWEGWWRERGKGRECPGGCGCVCVDE